MTPSPVRKPRLEPRVGLGIWRLAGPDRPPRLKALETIAAAYEAGVRVFDTADCYSLDEDDHGYGELLLRDALAGAGDTTIITKGGFARPGGEWEHRGHPRWLERAIEASARRLDVATIDCYLLHGIDPAVDLLDSLEPLAAAYESGLVHSIGISRVSAEQLLRARAAAPISVVENRLSVTVRTQGWSDVLRVCEEQDLFYLPHTPFGPTPEEDGSGRVVDEPVVQRIAAARGVSPAVVALAWLLALSQQTAVIPGARRPISILDSLRAAGVSLDAEEVEELSRISHRSVVEQSYASQT